MTSWKVPYTMLLSPQPPDPPVPLDRDEETTQPDDERVWFSLSESHTPSQLFMETLSSDPSLPFSPETPPTTMELSTTTETNSSRGQSLEPVAAPIKPHIAMATLLDHDSDDVIAVPVRSSAVTRYVHST